jgi:hypothetical protein
MTVAGSLGYDFERAILLEGERITVHYRVIAGLDGLNFLWASHPFLALGPTTRMMVDGFAGFCEVRNNGGRADFDWPDDGLTIAETLAPQTDKKLFGHAVGDDAGVVLTDPEGPSLTWRWSAADVPWLGVWLDRASLSTHLVAAIEPTNAGDDSLEVAASRRDSWTLSGGEERRWSISIAVGDTDPREPAARSKQEGTQ